MSAIFCEYPEGRIIQAETSTYTCKVCKISVRSSQKLLDHVNFSPLHKATLEGVKTETSDTRTTNQRRIIYDGSKLFWRINSTLELNISVDKSSNSLSINAFLAESNQKITPITIELSSLCSAISRGNEVVMKDAKGNEDELLTKYILARLHAKKDLRGSLCISIEKLNEDKYDPILMTNQAHNHGEIVLRRRHTFDELKEVTKGVEAAAKELRSARKQAERLSNLARVSLDAFSISSTKSDILPRRRSEQWFRAYSKVSLNKELTNTTEYLESMQLN